MEDEPRRPYSADASGKPIGDVTMLFTDIESSTWLLQRLGEQYSSLLDQHHAIIRRAIHDHDGHEVDTQGDSFFVVFSKRRALSMPP